MHIHYSVSVFLKHNDQVAGEELAEERDAGGPPGPLWVVAGEEAKDASIAHGTCPADAFSRGNFEKLFV
ncbi:hypothetical protein SAMN05660745_02556 [Corynebacterium glucuronolyticum]|nr:hypothetical protein HMPREF3044_02040 [Corynebacterium sp. HMSC073D01]WKD64676.1 hypothetical protein CGLUCO_12305 [Corynebacterium glucuronolyticum DSM 44120]SMB82117.1 hypothetical protein SAMN05660745_02556 [Corynebacterium glucuronolyticum]